MKPAPSSGHDRSSLYYVPAGMNTLLTNAECAEYQHAVSTQVGEGNPNDQPDSTITDDREPTDERGRS